MRLIQLLFLLTWGSFAFAEPEPFADMHLHFNWDQKEVTPAEEVVDRLKNNNIAIAFVTSTPPKLALELADAAGDDWLVPIFSPYLTPMHKDRWFADDRVLLEAEKGLASGRYKGIGELHIWSGFGPGKDKRILHGLLKLAEQYNVPFLIHTGATNRLFFTPICKAYPNVTFLWAHAGSRLEPEKVDTLMQQCPNVWTEVSARDPWRYDGLVDSDMQLLPGWQELFIKYQNRFMTGTDPVWKVANDHRWANADEGWNHYDQLLQFHRNWLKQLPPEIEKKIRLSNAETFIAGIGDR